MNIVILNEVKNPERVIDETTVFVDSSSRQTEAGLRMTYQKRI